MLWPLAFLLFGALVFVMRAHDRMPDFEVYHTAASRVLYGEPLYQTDDQRPFTFLPAVAIVMTPFALAEREAAKVLWFALSVGLLTAFVRWAVHGLPERRRSDDTLQWLTAAIMLPFYARELSMGQTDVLLGALLMGSLLAAQVELPRVAGVLLGVAIFIKPYALLLLPWLAFAHGARAAVATGLVLAAGLILPALLFGWTGNVQTLVSWFRLLTGGAAPTGAERLADSVSIGSMWVGWFGLHQLTIALAVLSTTVVLGLITTVWVHRRTVFDPDYLEFALLLLLIPLLSVRAGDYTLLLATPAVMALLDRWGETSRRWQVVTGTAVAVMSLAVLDLPGARFRVWFDGSGLVTVAALCVVVAAARLRWKGLA